MARKPSGSQPNLTAEQLKKLVEELNLGATSHGFPSHIWARSRVNELIGRLFGVSYDLTQVGRILKKVGWSLHKPARKARQQNKQKAQLWQEETVPELNRIDFYDLNNRRGIKIFIFFPPLYAAVPRRDKNSVNELVANIVLTNISFFPPPGARFGCFAHVICF
ncbi:helix-turn-helix domain-containing protein [Arundinibacter roseus]|uniref:Winged helix-turn-helix domain-containing protein n=1 Tax=Arundinibacter roseus TaxID=2070510 RepID=A0A4R4JV47_9BACT|nr:winged helix-turn-helix domain-containing protein [Arundinibacter roseus]TDB57962.1 winged helix-turn-helix domain-containing protein [Arundinibacter roseus]